MGETIFFDISLIIIICAILSWGALLLRQPIIIAYLAAGLLLGTSGFGLIQDVSFINGISRIGITLLLFLAGIILHPRRLKELLRQTILLTLANSLISGIICILFCMIWGFDPVTSIFIGLPLIFSSTILVLKLVPTTALHHKRMGSYCIAILIAQDLIAITMLIFMGNHGTGENVLLSWLLLPLKTIALIVAVFGIEQFVLRRIMAWCDRFHETLQIISIGWCLGIAVVAEHIGLSYEIGAFLAGVALARSPLSFFLSEELKPFRDFFLVFFFFALGTRLDLTVARPLILPAILLTLMMMATKYFTFRTLFRFVGEPKLFAHETGMRLAQASEFSLIVAVVAHTDGWLSDRAFIMVQLVTIFSLIISSCIVVARFPSPLATNPKLKQD
ncbi:MAG: cation:proton antiporter [Kiritimatiellaceae bacterium]|nr:cation:proton antiporter [Kiritimatiellaceae bacterium]